MASCHIIHVRQLHRHKKSNLFPYTTLFRSEGVGRAVAVGDDADIDRIGQVGAVEAQGVDAGAAINSAEHTSEDPSPMNLVCGLLLEDKDAVNQSVLAGDARELDLAEAALED